MPKLSQKALKKRNNGYANYMKGINAAKYKKVQMELGSNDNVEPLEPVGQKSALSLLPYDGSKESGPSNISGQAK